MTRVAVHSYSTGWVERPTSAHPQDALHAEASVLLRDGYDATVLFVQEGQVTLHAEVFCSDPDSAPFYSLRTTQPIDLAAARARIEAGDTLEAADILGTWE